MSYKVAKLPHGTAWAPYGVKENGTWIDETPRSKQDAQKLIKQLQAWDKSKPKRNPRSAISGGVPRGVWGRAVDALAMFKRAGNAWSEAGRPRNSPLYAEFCAAEKEYNTCRDEADKWDWNDEQSAEWKRVNRAFDPLLPGQEGYKANPKRGVGYARKPGTAATAQRLTRYAKTLDMGYLCVVPTSGPHDKYEARLPDGTPYASLGLSEATARKELARLAKAGSTTAAVKRTRVERGAPPLPYLNPRFSMKVTPDFTGYGIYDEEKGRYLSKKGERLNFEKPQHAEKIARTAEARLRGPNYSPFTGNGWTEEKAWLDTSRVTKPRRVSPARARAIIAAAREGAVGPWSDSLNRHMTPAEHAFITKVWEKLPGSTSFVGALSTIAQGKSPLRRKRNP